MKTLLKFLGSIGLIGATLMSASAVQVTLQVNMSVQIALGVFDPVNDFVSVAGTFNAWSETANYLSPTATNSEVYEATIDVGAAGTFPNFKFIKNRLVGGVQWENDGVGTGGAQNRYFEVPATDATLDAVYFNNIDSVNVNHADVMFQVNMSTQIAQGSFDPETGTLLVAGNAINNWDIDVAPLALTRSLENPDIWTITLSVTNPVGSLVSYKYIMNGNWETIPDRNFVMTNEAQVLPEVYFNNVSSTAVPIPLTFRVNMGVQEALGNFNPENGDVVEVRGSFLMGAGSTWLGGFVLTNDPANPVIYSGTIVDTNDAAGSTVQYQFVLNNGATWETAVGNRTVTLTSTNAITFPLAFFNNVNDLGAVSLGEISAGQRTLTWNAGVHVRLQSSTNLTSWQDVLGTEGQGTATVETPSGTEYFRLVGP